MVEIILATLNAGTLILVAILQTTSNRNKKVEEERYQRRLRHEELTIHLIQCDVQMSILSAKKQAGEHINGELKKAIDSTECAFAEYVNFACKEIAGSIAKK